MKQKLQTIRWLFSCLIFLNTGCENKKYTTAKKTNTDALKLTETEKKIKIDFTILKEKIQSGDVITRTGNDFTSQSLKKLNRRDETFSHCGIANIENDSLFIYHAIGGEYNPNQKIKRELFENFSTILDNNAIGIFRFNIDKKTNCKVVAAAKYFHKAAVIFDLDFDLKTDDKMYCAEYIYKCFLAASDSAIKFNHSFIKNFEFVGVDDITLHKLSNKIAVLNYRLY